MVLNFGLPFCPEVVKAQTICVRLVLAKQTVLHSFPLSGVNLALEHRKLYSLTVIFTNFRDPPKALLTSP